MVATYTAVHLNTQSECRMVDYDIDGALNFVDLAQPQGTSTQCLPLATFRKFRAGVFRSVGTGTVDAFHIVAATSAAGAGVQIVCSHAIGSAPDAVGDTIWLECDVEQIREVLPTATHVGAKLDLLTAGDECVVFFERADPFYGPIAGLTADYIA